MLKVHLIGGDVHAYGEGEAAFARFVASLKLFYKKTGDRYTPLEVSTIATYMRNAKNKVMTEIAKEKAEKKKQKREKRKRKQAEKDTEKS